MIKLVPWKIFPVLLTVMAKRLKMKYLKEKLSHGVWPINNHNDDDYSSEIRNVCLYVVENMVTLETGNTTFLFFIETFVGK